MIFKLLKHCHECFVMGCRSFYTAAITMIDDLTNDRRYFHEHVSARCGYCRAYRLPYPPYTSLSLMACLGWFRLSKGVGVFTFPATLLYINRSIYFLGGDRSIFRLVCTVHKRESRIKSHLEEGVLSPVILWQWVSLK